MRVALPDLARIRPRPALLALAALAVFPGADAAAHDIQKAAPGSTYKALRGLGPAKAEGRGLLRVKLRNDDTVLTHGPDAEPAGEGARAAATPGDPPAVGGPERQPVCASDHHQHVLYGYPADRASRFAAVKATILGEIKRMNAALNEEALASGGRSADYKVRCDGEGEVRVDTFESSEADAATTFSGVLSAARDAGFDSQNADYTIFFDSSVPPACGTGTYSPDHRLSAENHNNAGGDYAVVYSNCWTNRTAMHENGHNQGAVQYDAPFSTGDGAHCTDGYDVMCYSDGGNKDLGMSVFCWDKLRFDCRHDTYFDTAPEAGDYLASNWNLGSELNRFIAFDAPPPPPTAACEDPGCSSPLDDSNVDPAPPVERLPSPTPTPAPQARRRLPTLSRAAARRYARGRIARRHRRAKRIRATCSRRTRTSARCKVRWTVGGRAAYSGRMVVGYRLRGGTVGLAASSSKVRRVR